MLLSIFVRETVALVAPVNSIATAYYSEEPVTQKIAISVKWGSSPTVREGFSECAINNRVVASHPIFAEGKVREFAMQSAP